jgi:carboxypeptidase family protein/TonB-dependent receptor-like protein
MTKPRVSTAQWAGLALIIGLMTPAPAAAHVQDRRSVRGVVVDSTGNSLPYVNVVAGSSRVVSTDSGQFLLRLATKEPFKLTLFRIGFEPTEAMVAAGSDTTIRVVMSPLPVRLSGIRVEGVQMSSKLELRGFYDRMREVESGINRGYFITPEDLERRKAPNITQMFEGYPSIRVFTRGGRDLTSEIQGTNGCKMTVYLDGIRVVGMLNPGAEEPINTVVRPSSIAGAEIYPRGVGAPPKYQSLNGSCGVVLIWTR